MFLLIIYGATGVAFSLDKNIKNVWEQVVVGENERIFETTLLFVRRRCL